MNDNILIVGGGAIGGIIAARLNQKGIAAGLLVNAPELKQIARNPGLTVHGFHGDFQQKLNAYLPSDLLNERFAIVLIATKATEMANAAKAVLPFIHEDSLVVSLQNGICEDDLAEIVGKHRTVGCVTGWGATMIRRGEYDMTSGGEFIIGALEPLPEEKMLKLQSILKHIVPVHISKNIYGDLYSKLIINSCITTLGAITGENLGPMLAKKKLRNLFRAIMKEGIQVSNALNIQVEPYANKIDYYTFTREGWLQSIRQHLVIRIIGIKYRRLKSSALQSLERGKKTEIDWFNGYILRNAQKAGIHAPVNEKLVQIIKRIENGEETIGYHNLEDPFFRNF